MHANYIKSFLFAEVARFFSLLCFECNKFLTAYVLSASDGWEIRIESALYNHNLIRRRQHRPMEGCKDTNRGMYMRDPGLCS